MSFICHVFIALALNEKYYCRPVQMEGPNISPEQLQEEGNFLIHTVTCVKPLLIYTLSLCNVTCLLNLFAVYTQL